MSLPASRNSSKRRISVAFVLVPLFINSFLPFLVSSSVDAQQGLVASKVKLSVLGRFPPSNETAGLKPSEPFDLRIEFEATTETVEEIKEDDQNNSVAKVEGGGPPMDNFNGTSLLNNGTTFSITTNSSFYEMNAFDTQIVEKVVVEKNTTLVPSNKLELVGNWTIDLDADQELVEWIPALMEEFDFATTLGFGGDVGSSEEDYEGGEEEVEEPNGGTFHQQEEAVETSEENLEKVVPRNVSKADLNGQNGTFTGENGVAGGEADDEPNSESGEEYDDSYEGYTYDYDEPEGPITTTTINLVLQQNASEWLVAYNKSAISPRMTYEVDGFLVVLDLGDVELVKRMPESQNQGEN